MGYQYTVVSGQKSFQLTNLDDTVLTASSEYSNEYTADKLKSNGYWCSARGNNTNAWIEIKFPEPIRTNGFSVKSKVGYSTRMFKNFIMDADGEEVLTGKRENVICSAVRCDWDTFFFSTTITATTFRLLMKDNYGEKYFCLEDFQMRKEVVKDVYISENQSKL